MYDMKIFGNAMISRSLRSFPFTVPQLDAPIAFPVLSVGTATLAGFLRGALSEVCGFGVCRIEETHLRPCLVDSFLMKSKLHPF